MKIAIIGSGLPFLEDKAEKNGAMTRAILNTRITHPY